MQETHDQGGHSIVIDTSPSSAPPERPHTRGWGQGALGAVSELLNGALQGIMCIFFGVGFAALIFAHTPGGTAIGIGLFLIAYVVMNLVLAVGSRIQPTIMGPQDTTIVVLVAMATTLTAQDGAHTPQAVLATLLVLIVISSVLLGAAFLVLGTLRLGQMIRYLPYPVIGGFLAGTGWLILVSGLGITTAHPITSLGDVTPSTLAQIVAAVVLALALPLLARLVRNHLTLVGTLVAATLLFYGVLLVFGIPVGEARAGGWLLDRMPSGSLFHLYWIEWLPQTDWGQVLNLTADIFTLLVINVVAALLNIAAVEVAIHKSADVNDELRVRGIANLLTGILGGVAGYDYVSLSVMAQRGGARRRIVPFAAAFVVLAILVHGSVVLGLIPRFLTAGLVIYLGGSLLVEWLVGMWSAVSHIEYAIVVLITLVIAIAGFFPGAIVGTLAAVVLFVVNYSRTGVIKHDLAGTAYHSNVDRPLDHQQILRERSGAIHVYELQGYVFFGTAYRVLERVRERLAQGSLPALRYTILDFRHVTGLDSSAAYSLAQVHELLAEHKAALLYSHLTPAMRVSLRNTGATTHGEDGVRDFPDVDRALEWCEDQLLADLPDIMTQSLAARLASAMDESYSEEDIQTRLLAHLEYGSAAPGERLTQQGEIASEMFLIDTGQVAVLLELPTGESLRLRVMDAGTLIGELAYYRNAPRTASVVALEPTTYYMVTKERMRALEAHDAPMVAAFHAYVARVLSERLTTMDGTVAALLR